MNGQCSAKERKDRAASSRGPSDTVVEAEDEPSQRAASRRRTSARRTRSEGPSESSSKVHTGGSSAQELRATSSRRGEP